jgi:hypothetical protein
MRSPFASLILEAATYETGTAIPTLARKRGRVANSGACSFAASPHTEG